MALRLTALNVIWFKKSKKSTQKNCH